MTATECEPITLAGVREAVLRPGRIQVRGAGTKSTVSADVEPDTVVVTTKLSHLLTYHPAEGTARVQAGMPLRDLHDALGVHRQWLAIDPPLTGDGATLGGVYASGDHGPHRHGFGTLRDLVIGSTVVLADGSVSRSGGNVIKNVAGYDLSKLWHGSFGSLGVVVDLTVRVHPRPHATGTIRLDADAPTATRLMLDILATPVEPVAIEWEGTGDDGSMWVRFHGRRAGVDARLDAVARLVTGRAVDAVERTTDDDAVWARLREAHAGGDGETAIRMGTLPSQLADVVAAVREATAPHPAIAPRLHSHAGLGLHTLRLTGGPPAAHAALIAALRTAVRPLGGHITVRRRLDGVPDEPRPATPLERRVKEALDPDGRLVGGGVAW